MGRGPARQEKAQIEKLEQIGLLDAELDRILGRAMGVRTQGFTGGLALEPIALIFAWLTLYAGLWMAAVGLAGFYGMPNQPKFFSLLAWGGFYFAAALFLAQTSTRRIRATIASDIVPYASAAYLASITADLRKTYPATWFTAIPILVGIVALGFAAWTIDRDVGEGSGHVRLSPQLLFWGATYLLYFITAARAVMAARFYVCFARCLEQERDSFYVLTATQSTLIKGLSKLGGQVLGFWALIFLTILSILVLVLAPELYRFDWSSWLLSTLIPIAVFFSFGFGTIVYLESESRIRAALRRFTQQQAAILQEKANAILNPARRRVPGDAAELQRLADWHDRILAGGNYGSRVRASLSILLPFIPFLGLIQTFYGWWSR